MRGGHFHFCQVTLTLDWLTRVFTLGSLPPPPPPNTHSGKGTFTCVIKIQKLSFTAKPLPCNQQGTANEVTPLYKSFKAQPPHPPQTPSGKRYIQLCYQNTQMFCFILRRHFCSPHPHPHLQNQQGDATLEKGQLPWTQCSQLPYSSA